MSKKPPAIDAMHPVDKILFPILIELHGAFSQMQEKLADYIDYLKETTSAKEKIENELSIAQEILLSMTPHSFPPLPNLPQVDLYATLNSAREVGGNFYDSFRMDDYTLLRHEANNYIVKSN